ncbi:MAG: OmpA family protein [Saprospiraceae bacterium]|nr:OmpA family protein [Saprospiraceae bacterium]
MKTLLWIATVVFFLISWWWYVCPHKQVCPFGNYSTTHQPISREDDSPKSETSTSPVTTPVVNIGPLVFNWSSDEPVTNADFPRYRDSLLANLRDNDVLEILGGYFNSEQNNTSFPDLGIARANQIRNLFKDLPDSRFDLKGAVFQREVGSEKDRPFLASHFRRIVNNESVREVEGRMVINFPYASDEMLDNAKLNDYLNDLVTRLKSTEEKVKLVGHTDSSAGANRNMRLGLMRADAIKNLLIRKGLSESRIITESKGETTPIASNDTSEGRRLNRRVELTIIP